MGRDKVREARVVGGEGRGQVDFLEEAVPGLGLGGLRRREGGGRNSRQRQEQAQRLSAGQQRKESERVSRAAC